MLTAAVDGGLPRCMRGHSRLAGMDNKKPPNEMENGNSNVERRARTPYPRVAAIEGLEKLEKLDPELAASFKPDIERRKKPRSPP